MNFYLEIMQTYIITAAHDTIVSFNNLLAYSDELYTFLCIAPMEGGANDLSSSIHYEFNLYSTIYDGLYGDGDNRYIPGYGEGDECSLGKDDWIFDNPIIRGKIIDNILSTPVNLPDGLGLDWNDLDKPVDEVKEYFNQPKHTGHDNSGNPLDKVDFSILSNDAIELTDVVINYDDYVAVQEYAEITDIMVLEEVLYRYLDNELSPVQQEFLSKFMLDNFIQEYSISESEKQLLIEEIFSNPIFDIHEVKLYIVDNVNTPIMKAASMIAYSVDRSLVFLAKLVHTLYYNYYVPFISALDYYDLRITYFSANPEKDLSHMSLTFIELLWKYVLIGDKMIAGYLLEDDRSFIVLLSNILLMFGHIVYDLLYFGLFYILKVIYSFLNFFYFYTFSICIQYLLPDSTNRSALKNTFFNGFSVPSFYKTNSIFKRVSEFRWSGDLRGAGNLALAIAEYVRSYYFNALITSVTNLRAAILHPLVVDYNIIFRVKFYNYYDRTFDITFNFNIFLQLYLNFEGDVLKPIYELIFLPVMRPLVYFYVYAISGYLILLRSLSVNTGWAVRAVAEDLLQGFFNRPYLKYLFTYLLYGPYNFAMTSIAHLTTRLYTGIFDVLGRHTHAILLGLLLGLQFFITKHYYTYNITHIYYTMQVDYIPMVAVLMDFFSSLFQLIVDNNIIHTVIDYLDIRFFSIITSFISYCVNGFFQFFIDYLSNINNQIDLLNYLDQLTDDIYDYVPNILLEINKELSYIGLDIYGYYSDLSTVVSNLFLAYYNGGVLGTIEYAMSQVWCWLDGGGFLQLTAILCFAYLTFTSWKSVITKSSYREGYLFIDSILGLPKTIYGLLQGAFDITYKLLAGFISFMKYHIYYIYKEVFLWAIVYVMGFLALYMHLYETSVEMLIEDYGMETLTKYYLMYLSYGGYGIGHLFYRVQDLVYHELFGALIDYYFNHLFYFTLKVFLWYPIIGPAYCIGFSRYMFRKTVRYIRDMYWSIVEFIVDLIYFCHEVAYLYYVLVFRLCVYLIIILCKLFILTLDTIVFLDTRVIVPLSYELFYVYMGIIRAEVDYAFWLYDQLVWSTRTLEWLGNIYIHPVLVFFYIKLVSPIWRLFDRIVILLHYCIVEYLKIVAPTFEFVFDLIYLFTCVITLSVHYVYYYVYSVIFGILNYIYLVIVIIVNIIFTLLCRLLNFFRVTIINFKRFYLKYSDYYYQLPIRTYNDRDEQPYNLKRYSDSVMNTDNASDVYKPKPIIGEFDVNSMKDYYMRSDYILTKDGLVKGYISPYSVVCREFDYSVDRINLNSRQWHYLDESIVFPRIHNLDNWVIEGKDIESSVGMVIDEYETIMAAKAEARAAAIKEVTRFGIQYYRVLESEYFVNTPLEMPSKIDLDHDEFEYISPIFVAPSQYDPRVDPRNYWVEKLIRYSINTRDTIILLVIYDLLCVTMGP